MSQLKKVYESLDSVTTLLRPALPFINSHLTDFFTASYWDTLLPRTLREELDCKSVEEIKEHIRDISDGNWRRYPCSMTNHRFDFNSNDYTFNDLIVTAGRFQLSEMNISVPLHELCVNGKKIYLETEADIDLKFDTFMSAKKTHEVEVMSNFVKRVSQSVQLGYDLSGSGSSDVDSNQNIEYLVDVGSGKGYLSSFLTLLYDFKVLAVDSSSINTTGCEKRSSKLEKTWTTLVRRAVERKTYGTCTRRGKHWKSKKDHNVAFKNDKDQSLQETENAETSKVEEHEQDNKLLKTLTQFVNPDFDLTESLQDNFPCYSCLEPKSPFGLIGLHTCGALGVDSLYLFIANEKAKFICNVPCCYHLLEENPLFYPSRKFEGSKLASRGDEDFVNSILTPGFPISKKLDVGDGARFCLGRNARMMSAYSLKRMVNEEKGMDLHPSIFNRCVLQVLIKRSLGDKYWEMEDYKYNVGKIGDKCSTFVEYIRRGLENMRLQERVQPSDEEIEELHLTFEKENERLHKYYLLRSIFAPLVEGCILLDRLAFLLEQKCVEEAFIVELFDAAVSPRSHSLFAYKR